jgi:REP element-mobilizing transposase RayT
MSDKFQDIYRIPSARAEWWDYWNDAAYFVTISTAGREHYFGEIVNGYMQFLEIGQIAHQNWILIPVHFAFIKLEAFVVMPNHVHGILVIDHSVESPPVETLHATL